MNDTRELFERVLADEPPLRLTVEPVVAAGRRVRRRRRMAYAACSLSLVAVAAAGVPLLLSDTAAVAPAGPVSFDPRLAAEERRIVEVISARSPAAVTYRIGPKRWDGDILDGTVDDGQGAVFLTVVRLGGTTYRPCGTPAATCSERRLDDGSVVTVRLLWNGERRLRQAFLVRPDGTGVIVNTGNHARGAASPTRPGLLYTEDELTTLVLALGEVLRG
ncbi:MAG TPA: hypothetical protein VNQ77_11775 [Frankiaceae bacterium]|nr:hypothetical protein [Frankiaceae bacterium]